MLYVAHAQLPTSTRHALKCDFIKPGIDSLVLGKHSSIEVYGIEPDGLKLLHQRTVFDVIDHINSYKKKNDSTATILILTAGLKLFTIRFCAKTDTIITLASISLHQIGARPADYVQTSIVDPHGRCVVLHALNGMLHVIPIASQSCPKSKLLHLILKRQKTGRLRNSTSHLHADHDKPDGELYRTLQLRLNEVNVHALSFASLPSSYPPVLLIVYSNHHGDRVLRSRKIDLSAGHCDDEFFQCHNCLDPVTGLIIPVSLPNTSRGDNSSDDPSAILVGEESAKLVRFSSQKASTNTGKGKSRAAGTAASQRKQESDQLTIVSSTVRLPLGAYTCFCKIDELPYSWLLGDLYGNLIILRLEQSPAGGTLCLKYEHVGYVPSPEALVYIPHGFVFLASHYGDSQLLKLSSILSPLGSQHMTGESPEVITTFTNLAPISDFCVTKDLQSSLNQIVTCSGAYRDGSLRVIKHGIGLRVSGSLEVVGVQRLWALKNSSPILSTEDFDDRIVLSFADCTRFLILNADNTIEEVDQLNGFRADVPTILAGNLVDLSAPDHRYSLQVTCNQVIAGPSLVWEPDNGESVTSAAMSVSLCAVSTKRQVWVLQLKKGLFAEVATCEFLNDVSSLAIDPGENFIAAGQWVTNSVEIMSISTKSCVYRFNTGSDFTVNSLVITNFEQPECDGYRLLIGLGDGQIMNVGIDLNGIVTSENSTPMITLGLRPIELVTIKNQNQKLVWANCDQPSIITQSKITGRTSYTPANVPGGWVTSATGLQARNFQNSVILAFNNEIRIVTLNEQVKMNAMKIALGSEQPRRIAHSNDMRAYGVVCIRLELDQQSGTLQRVGSVKIFDDETFELLYDFKLLEIEQGSSIAAIRLGKDMVEHFVVGTGWIKACEVEAKSGRLLAIRDMDSSQRGPGRSRNFRLTHVGRLSGSVGGLGALPNGMFVASANAFVHAFGIKEVTPKAQEGNESNNEGSGDEETDGTFKLLDTWGGGFVSQTVVTYGTKVLVGDLYKSVVLLEFDLDTLELTVKARDFGAMSVRPIGTISDREFIAADSEFNMFTLQYRRPSLSSDEEGANNEVEAFRDKLNEMDDEMSSNEDHEDVGDDIGKNDVRSPDNPTVGEDDLFQVGAFYLGENVNHFRMGSLIPSHIEARLIGKTKLLFVSSTGGIGSIIKIESKKKLQRLVEFQSDLSQVSKSLGHLDHSMYRMFKSKSRKLESRGFIDGDFLEGCLEMKQEELEGLMNKTKQIRLENKSKKTDSTTLVEDPSIDPKNAHSESFLVDSSGLRAQFNQVLDDLDELRRLH